MDRDRNGHPDGTRCPTCNARVMFVVNQQCRECGDDETVAIIERLQPDDEE